PTPFSPSPGSASAGCRSAPKTSRGPDMTNPDTRRPNRVKRAAKWALVVALSVVALAYHYKGSAGQRDAAGARAAFREAYKVFMHPRCMNCHPVGDAPLQGDDSRPHLQNVQRGPSGKGKYALKCANCHQDANLPGANMPPGNPNWHLTPPDMPMV